MDSTTSQREAASPGLVQAPLRRLALEAWALAAQTGFVLRSGAEAGDAATLVAENRILGEARLSRDKLGRSGVPDEAGALPLAIQPMPEGASKRMLLVLDHGGESGGFHVALWLPPEVFSGLKQDVEAGRAGYLTLSATTNLWIVASEREAPAETSVTWLLGRDDDGAVQAARGLVERVNWSAAPPASPEPAPEDIAVAAASPEEDAEPPETVAEALVRLNWSLKQIALVLVFLLIVVALK